MSIIKQAVGIDVSKDKIDVVYGTLDVQQAQEAGKVRVYKNQRPNFSKMVTWLERQRKQDMPLLIVMEATGVYYEKLAYYLEAKGYQVVVALPNMTKAFAKSLNQKSKTDKLDAQMLLRFGLERQHTLWQPCSPELSAIKKLMREREQIIERITATSNQHHALGHSYEPSKSAKRRQRQLLGVLERQLAQVEKEMKKLLRSTDELKQATEFITSIVGIGEVTAACVMAETDLFAQVRHGNQLSSYAGLDPVLCESGKFKGKVKISGKGNSHIRRALYWPAIAAIKYNPQMKAFYQRVSAKKEYKRTALIAVMRKLLVLMWTLCTKKQKYDPTFGLS